MHDHVAKPGALSVSSPDPIHEADLEALLRALLNTPFVGRRKPWQVVLIQNPELLEQLGSLFPGSPSQDASYAVVVCGDRKVQRQLGPLISDCYDATTSLLFTARMKLLRLRTMRTFPHRQQIAALRELLGIPEHVIPYSVTLLRRRLAESEPASVRHARIHFERWS